MRYEIFSFGCVHGCASLTRTVCVTYRIGRFIFIGLAFGVGQGQCARIESSSPGIKVALGR
jgi:hypothetical protein